jgi:peptidylprolyl isomerase
MAQAKEGDSVKVHYTGKLDDGTVFDSSHGKDPLTFIIGDGKVIPGVEHAVLGMEPGDRKTEKIACEQAFGPHETTMVFIVGKGQIPEGLDPQTGQRLRVQHSDGRTAKFLVVAVSDDTVTLDANHPLAGKNLLFDLELIEIN